MTTATGVVGIRLSQPIQRTYCSQSWLCHHMSVNHRRRNVGMPQQVLNSANVRPHVVPESSLRSASKDAPS